MTVPYRRLICAAAAALSCSACEGDVTRPSPPDQAYAASSHAHAPARTTPGLYYRIARDEVAGFGGMFFDSAGTPVVYLKDASQKGRAQAALAHLLSERRRAGRDGRFAPTEIAVRIGRYDYLELLAWKNRLDDALVGVPGVVMTAIKDSQNRIVAGVESEAARGEVLRRAEAAGVPREALTVSRLEPPRRTIGPATSLRDTFSVVPGGVRISVLDPGDFRASSCTLGFNLRSTIDTTVAYFATNFHCTRYEATLRPGAPMQIFQPLDNTTSASDLSRLQGYEVWDPPFDPNAAPFMYFFSHPEAHCPQGGVCRAAEVAWGRYRSADQYALGRIARPALLNPSTTMSPTVEDFEPYHVVDPANPTFRINGNSWYVVEGQVVDKVGATSGRTRATIGTPCSLVYWNTQLNQYLLCSAVAEGGGAAGGDSGGPVFTDNGDGSVTLLGLMWGGGMPGPGRTAGLFTFSVWAGIMMDMPPDAGFGRFCDSNATGQCW
jgi:hypothetical protein